MNIGVITDGYIDWNGGLDFLKIILRGLESNKDNKLFLFFISENERKLRHAPIWLKKGYELINSNKRNTSIELFADYKNSTIVEYRMLNLREKIIENSIDVIFPSMINLGRDVPVKWCLELFDCQHKYFPQYFTSYRRWYRDFFYKKALRNSDYVIVNSETAKRDFSSFYRTSAKPDKIKVLPLCPTLNHDYLGKDNATIKGKYDITAPYFIISNQFWKHKAHDTAFRALSEVLHMGYDKVSIVCTGFMGDYRGDAHITYLMGLIKDLKIEEHVKLLGFIPKKDQIELMKQSQGVIQPSQYEGDCSGQVIDAICVGQRSIVSDIEVCKEVSYIDTITYFKLDNVHDLAEKMVKLLITPYERPSYDELVKQEEKYLNRFSTSLNTIINTMVSE